MIMSLRNNLAKSCTAPVRRRLPSPLLIYKIIPATISHSIWYHSEIMARVAITEYAAKKLVLGDIYTGVTVIPESADEVVATLPEKGVFIVKIDVGIKKRGKQGLVRINIQKSELKNALQELFVLGHHRCVIEEMVSHETADQQNVRND